MAGAPGSKWSSVCKNVYYSSSIDCTDFSKERTYYHSAWGTPQLMHLGAYFDPGMEFGDRFDELPWIPKEEAEAEFLRPFKGLGTRIVKSHVFCHYLDYLKCTWPEDPIILVHRPDDACLGWWVKCGHFDITYPKYDYYQDLKTMALHIHNQNNDLKKFMNYNKVITVDNSWMLCDLLKINKPPTFQNYKDDDINVYLYWSYYE
jgi:hypothetical protein